MVAVGPAAPREFVETLASPALLQPVVDTVQGGMPRLEEGFPALRAVRDSSDAATIEAATQALAQGTEAFAARRINKGITLALAAKNL